MGTAALTYTLTAGTNENVNQVQQNLVDLRDFLNSGTGIGTNNIAVLPACRVRKTTAQSINDSTATAVTFDAERFDTNSMHDTSSNTSRITFNTAGVYVVTANISFASNATGRRYVGIRLNGTTSLALDSRAALNGDSSIFSVPVIYSFAAADYVEIMVTQTSGGALNVEATGNQSPEFSAAFITRAS